MRCDIVIPVWNQRLVTEECVDSLLKNTGGDWRLIIVDNGSADETRAYLGHLARSEPSRVLVVRNDRNLGFIRAVNRGIALSDAPFVCLLNNDTIVTGGWLDEMLSVLTSEPDIGIVNPSSNNLGQKPAGGEPIEHYARTLAKERGAYVELGSAVGFCMLMRRALLDRIGSFDEAYGMGNFEDTDLSRRAVRAGYRCVRSCGAYVYHRESASFKKVKSFNADFERNRRLYESRWGVPRRVACILDSGDAGGVARLNEESLRLARDGNWVWYFLRAPLEVPAHSNIRVVRLPARWFWLFALAAILKKKKRFSEISVRTTKAAGWLKCFRFVHGAEVKALAEFQGHKSQQRANG